ncbi:MAG: nucleotide exchange factor GrpE [Turneriella sp.]|nr:nucleotide exchange factor GrpE [Leptospiraceae bacterium]MCX7632473.1 nucleotide exchange factor GrpE [Turneriella sp.]
MAIDDEKQAESSNPNENDFATEEEEIASIKARQAEEAGGQIETAGQTNEEATDTTAELRQQIEALTADLQRERAEFVNYRKRVVLEKAQQAAQQSARLLKDLLPALDALDQFFAAYEPKAETDSTIKAIVDGVKLVQKQILRVFTEAGVEEFYPQGEEFNPALMEAISTQDGDVERETVTQVFQKGYRLEGRLIRPARVAVIRPRPKAETQSQPAVEPEGSNLTQTTDNNNKNEKE